MLFDGNTMKTKYSFIPKLFVIVALATPLLRAEEAHNPALGSKIYAENCARCHAIPDPGSRSKRQWVGITMHMRIFSDISHEEADNLLAFLKAYNTSSIKHKRNTAAVR